LLITPFGSAVVSRANVFTFVFETILCRQLKQHSRTTTMTSAPTRAEIGWCHFCVLVFFFLPRPTCFAALLFCAAISAIRVVAMHSFSCIVAIGNTSVWILSLLTARGSVVCPSCQLPSCSPVVVTCVVCLLLHGSQGRHCWLCASFEWYQMRRTKCTPLQWSRCCESPARNWICQRPFRWARAVWDSRTA
jgi:hypothetical protein